jgi:hypothetical protein
MRIFKYSNYKLSYLNKYFSSTLNKPLPSKFSDLLSTGMNYQFIDRTAILNKMLESKNTELILRPDNFGKTFNLEMLRFFLQSSRYINEDIDGHKCLEFFKRTEVYRDKPFFDEHFSKYPVVAFNFEELDEATFDDNIEKFRQLLASQLHQLYYYDGINNLSDIDKKLLEGYLTKRDDTKHANLQANDLCRMITKVTRQTPFVLIDSYDSPLLNAHKRDFYNEMLSFVQSLFGNVINHNKHINKAIITGTHKLDSERLFYPIKNLDIYGTPGKEDKYCSYFGIKESELDVIYNHSSLGGVKDYSSIKRNILTRYTFYNKIEDSESYAKYISNKLDLPKMFEKAIAAENGIALIKTLANLELRSQDKLNGIEKQYNEIKPDSELVLSEISKNSLLTYLYDNGLVNKDGSVTNKLSAEIILKALPDIKDSNYDVSRKLAFGYYRYFYNNQVEEYLKYVQYIFKYSKEVPLFKENTDLERYIIDKLTFEMDNPDSRDNVEIYEVDDNEYMTVGDELKKFALITYERLRIALFVRGHRYKTTAGRPKASEADLKVTELFNNPNIDVKTPKRPLIKKVNKKTLEYQLRKINEANLSSIDKQEAIDYLIKLSGDYDTVYFVSIANYQRNIDYAIEASNLEKE